MQTFLPYPNLDKTFKCLDPKRLGKQRVEAAQILKAIRIGPGAPWYNHPAIQQWVGYEEILTSYYNACIKEWVARGYENNMQYIKINPGTDPVPLPWWWGDEGYHRSHRSRLIFKNEAWYLRYFPDDKGFNDSLYYWPDMKTKTFKLILPK